MDFSKVGYVLAMYGIGATVMLAVWLIYKLDSLLSTRDSEEVEDEKKGSGGGNDGRCFVCGELEAAAEYRVRALEDKFMETNRELEQRKQLIQLLTEELMGTNRELERLRQLVESLTEATEATTCQICFDKKREISFICGHAACEECASAFFDCHICREPITDRRRLFL